MVVIAHANGDPGALAVCSAPAAAIGAAAAAEACGPTSLSVHLGIDADLSVVRATGDADALAAAMSPSADVSLHRTATRSLLRHRRTWPLGATTPGVTMLFLTRTRAGLSADDYHRYWEREHGPRALRHHLGMWDYTQVSVTHTLRGEHLDGVAVTKWPRKEDLDHRFTDGPLGTAVLRHDSSQFTDLGVLERHLTEERVLVEAPWPESDAIEISDARHVEFGRPADAVWRLVGRFDAIRDWCDRFPASSASSEHGVGMTRTLTRRNGSRIVERLIEYRPDERMLQLAVDEGLPPTIESYTCRYEVRPDGAQRCTLDWYPRATVRAEAVGTFGAVVDDGWVMVADGLSAALAGDPASPRDAREPG